ncbi:C39 family peptidase [Dactylosporangium sp. NPDC048998]|uniref:C39 family peptidase n=1 Tax=Dactylosporangium sp. NPDC048998 TaxID=3363976 RepID=UPI003719E9BC
MTYLYKPRHSGRIPRVRRIHVAAGMAGLAVAAGIGVAALQQSSTPASAAGPQTLTGAESRVTEGGAPAAREKQRDRAVPDAASTPKGGAAKPTATAQAGAGSTSGTTADPTTAPPSPSAAASTAPPQQKDLPYQFAWQENYYFCGPAATRIALTARGLSPSQSQVAQSLGTTVNGTNSADDTTRALNSYTGTSFYKSHFITGQTATPAEAEQLKESVLNAIGQGFAVVANIAGSTVDDAGNGHSYSGGHYLTIVGYSDGGQTVKIADPADAQGVGSYTLSTAKMADWIAQRGYSA